jgi:hypothetical protein
MINYLMKTSDLVLTKDFCFACLMKTSDLVLTEELLLCLLNENI